VNRNKALVSLEHPKQDNRNKTLMSLEREPKQDTNVA
jgi:hypothetical protein